MYLNEIHILTKSQLARPTTIGRPASPIHAVVGARDAEGTIEVPLLNEIHVLTKSQLARPTTIGRLASPIYAVIGARDAEGNIEVAYRPSAPQNADTGSDQLSEAPEMGHEALHKDEKHVKCSAPPSAHPPLQATPLTHQTTLHQTRLFIPDASVVIFVIAPSISSSLAAIFVLNSSTLSATAH